jgi:CheY-like chemotaxis protein
MQQEQSSNAPVVLVVENDVLLRLVTANNLRDAGFEVIEAANSAEALRILECFPVDALFSDIDMPGTMNGLALAQWVHQRRLDTRIILTSSAARVLGGAKDFPP